MNKMPLLNNEIEEFCGEDTAAKFISYLKEGELVGDLLTLDYSEATVLVHDSLRKSVGGLPMGCFLLATRLTVDTDAKLDDEDSALLLLRVAGHSPLPNRGDTENWRFDAALRAIDSPAQWDADEKSDQFTRNLLRHAGVRCKVVGTFRYVDSSQGWSLNFGADISNFYSGQGMKVYKPMGSELASIVNFTKPTGGYHPLSGHPVEIGRVRYASTEIKVDESREHVKVSIEPTDMLARRTALFGMSRSGKSNTIKTLAASLFRLRSLDSSEGRVGQLIFDVNGEYCNDNPQDKGCLRAISKDDVVTYGLFPHPYDLGRRLIKFNFFGDDIEDWTDKAQVISSMGLLLTGKTIIDDHLLTVTGSQYIKNFINTDLTPTSDDWGMGDQLRCRRNIAVYRAILAKAGFEPPTSLNRALIGRLFGKGLRDAMSGCDENDIAAAASVFEQNSVPWSTFYSALDALQKFVLGGRGGHPRFTDFNRVYSQSHGRNWNDDTLTGLLSILQLPGGVAKIREMKNRHDASVSEDYSTEIVNELIDGKLVIVDQSTGSPTEVQYSSTRIMRELFSRQIEVFTNPKRDDNGVVLRDEQGGILPPPDVIVYVEEAHNLLPSQNADLSEIWPRIAKEGSKFRIGLVYSTQEPSSILSNILKNTDNWFVAHLNNQDETRELRKYYDFDLFVDQILKVPDTGFVRMRCLSNPYIVPVQINKFIVDTSEQRDEDKVVDD